MESFFKSIFKNKKTTVNVTFYKTKILSFNPYETKIVFKELVDTENVIKLIDDICENETNMEYSLCLNDNVPSYDNKKHGYRLNYTISNDLDNFTSSSIFKNLSQKLNKDILLKLNPSRCLFLLMLISFWCSSLDRINQSKLDLIESIMILKKEKKTSISYHIKECDNIEEVETMIKNVFQYNPKSLFNLKIF